MHYHVAKHLTTLVTYTTLWGRNPVCDRLQIKTLYICKGICSELSSYETLNIKPVWGSWYKEANITEAQISPQTFLRSQFRRSKREVQIIVMTLRHSCRCGGRAKRELQTSRIQASSAWSSGRARTSGFIFSPQHWLLAEMPQFYNLILNRIWAIQGRFKKRQKDTRTKQMKHPFTKNVHCSIKRGQILKKMLKDTLNVIEILSLSDSNSDTYMGEETSIICSIPVKKINSVDSLLSPIIHLRILWRGKSPHQAVKTHLIHTHLGKERDVEIHLALRSGKIWLKTEDRNVLQSQGLIYHPPQPKQRMCQVLVFDVGVIIVCNL